MHKGWFVHRIARRNAAYRLMRWVNDDPDGGHYQYSDEIYQSESIAQRAADVLNKEGEMK